MSTYIVVKHLSYGSIEEQPAEYVGPFPDHDSASIHWTVYGPRAGTVEDDIYEAPDPEQTMTPGQSVDHVLGRF